MDAVRRADADGTPLLLVAGGSNLVVGDDGFDGTVVQVATTGVDLAQDTCGGAVVTVAAGEPWDPFVARAVENGWVGLEALSGIPGSVGATPVQNVGAYGQEVADTVATVRCWDREQDRQRTFAAADCGFGYRTSRFKQRPGPLLVLAVTFQLRLGDLSAPVRYAELARTLGVAVGGRAPTGRGPRGGAGPARRQGHGPGRRGPRHLERRVVLHQPVPRCRPGGPAAAGGAPLAAAGRQHQDQRRLADRARRLHQGLRRTSTSPCRASTRSPSRTAGRPGPGTCWPSPARCRPASRRRTACGWSTSRCWSAASCPAPGP